MPTLTPVTTPSADTVATDSSDETYVTLLSDVFSGVKIGVNCVVPPTLIVSLVGVIAKSVAGITSFVIVTIQDIGLSIPPA